MLLKCHKSHHRVLDDEYYSTLSTKILYRKSVLHFCCYFCGIGPEEYEVDSGKYSCGK